MPKNRRSVYCCGCQRDVVARLTDGKEIYPHRADLHSLPFWICDSCGNYVGCAHKTRDRTRPLGVIPTPAIKNARQHIHRIMDPLWATGRISRPHLYAKISEELGHEYHTANIRSVEDARDVYKIICRITNSLDP